MKALLRTMLLAPVLVLVGCGSTEEAAQTPAPPPPPVPAAQEVRPKPDFETRTDTVAAVRRTSGARANPSHHTPQIRFMVQIGAFKDPENASRVQTLARERYHLPVVNDYHTKLALYQIRIGFFETRSEADVFRARMKQEHPTEYSDSWVVQLKR